jgi:hypothetical protein
MLNFLNITKKLDFLSKINDLLLKLFYYFINNSTPPFNFPHPKTIIPIMKTKSQNKSKRRDAMHCVSKPYCHPEPVEGLTFSRLQRRADKSYIILMPILRQAQDDINFFLNKF